MTGSYAQPSEEAARKQSREGIASALIAYLAWGFLPLFYILIKETSAMEILAHRVIWAVPFGALIIYYRGQWSEVRGALSKPKTLMLLSITSLLIAGNWLVFVWAVQAEQIFQSSLGYYINPLLFAVAGVFIFGEKLRFPQKMAIVLATLGVLVLTFSGGELPMIALFLGVTFTIYGVIRKKIVIGGMPGLFVETLVLLPFAGIFLLYQMIEGQAVFGTGDVTYSLLLMISGPLTVIPLLFFALAARRMNLSTLGMMQFIAPTIQFIVGVIYGEQLTTAHFVCFGCIWGAVLLFSWDGWRNSRRSQSATA